MNDMWARPLFPVDRKPFDHVCSDDFLPPDLFAELASSFPECPIASGPTGFTIHPGDPEFDQLMRASAPWREFRAVCDSPAFVDFVLRQFNERFMSAASVDLTQARHVQHVESRADKERRHMTNPVHAADALWTRFDLMQGRVGYQRGMHLDHRRRAATMLIYFTDPEVSGTLGGDLLLHDADGRATVVSPRANRLVMFPCCNDSWHSVSPIVRQSRPRNFLQVTLSSSVDLWPPLRQGLGARLRDSLKSLAHAR